LVALKLSWALVVRVKHWSSNKWMQSETLASSVWVWSSLHWVRSLPILGWWPQRHTARMLVLAPLVAHWLAQS
jgi:hypothetical protein